MGVTGVNPTTISARLWKSIEGVLWADIRVMKNEVMNAKYIFSSGKTSLVQTYTFDFYRDINGKWYIDYPEYIDSGFGTKANLEMVGVVELTQLVYFLELQDLMLEKLTIMVDYL